MEKILNGQVNRNSNVLSEYSNMLLAYLLYVYIWWSSILLIELRCMSCRLFDMYIRATEQTRNRYHIITLSSNRLMQQHSNPL